MAAGVTTAILAGIQLVYRPSEREAYELSLHKEYAKINTALPQLSTEDADKLVRATYETPEYEKEFIRHIAFNDVIDELGRDAAHKNSLTRTQRVLAYLLL